MATKAHGSSTEWITHQRVLNTFYPERGHHYYRLRDSITRYLTQHWRSMGLITNEVVVLEEMLRRTTAPWPWKFTLMGSSDFTANLFIVAGPSELRRAISGLRRKGFVNAGKVEMEGRGQWHGITVRYPVLEASSDLVYFCMGMGLHDEYPVRDVPLTGHLKVTKVRGRRCPDNPALCMEDYLYNGFIKSSLLIETVDSDGEDCVDLHMRTVSPHHNPHIPTEPPPKPPPPQGERDPRHPEDRE